MKENPKAKRDLKEVVNIFISKTSEELERSPKPKEPSHLPSKSLVVSFCTPFQDRETLEWNLIFPSLLLSRFKNCYLATHPLGTRDMERAKKLMGDYHPHRLRWNSRGEQLELLNNYYWVQWSNPNYFEPISKETHLSAGDIQNPMAGSLIVLDLFKSNTLGFEHLIQLLDHLVLIVGPGIRDLKNVYKVIKTCSYLNNRIQISLLFKSEWNQAEVETIFARFSGMVSKFLAFPIQCLGSIPMPVGNPTVVKEGLNRLNLESLTLGWGSKSPKEVFSLEKIRFLQKLSDLVKEGHS